ncbi:MULTISPECIES: GNAT family N-acetyltransferase [unclassified Hahella]|uniref:GNAT family N-acetyltransferase n=1 Tax=unclassified Hahella TaxID=2624107 RepID=UPI000FDD6B8F|nr:MULTISPECIES: GNAT family N-acetyltransferase [unclassified Hahella]AZZ92029.1 N-acetyltransferase [Hahella sp. KA22]MBU6953203.1 GNAT family N-acetyltransferase [Hahella sp. HN01]MDG9671023.1 GNAT family N-acetyltransferase [Hahella sp. CR1]QAY55400.1 GNAT family N-acetyltransferase [Hahella sp. KA22]
MTGDLVADTALVRLDRSALSEAKSILFHAYRHEPTFQYLFDSSRPGYDQRVRATIREGLELHFAHNQDALGLVDEDTLVAVAFIGSPEARFSLADQLNWRIRMMLTAGLSSTKRYIDYHEQVHACLPKDTHHHLPFIGVHPKYQSKGYGRMLMQVIEGICRESPLSSGIGLDTGNARYLRFYLGLGYEKVGEVRLGNVTETVLFKPCH